MLQNNKKYCFKNDRGHLSREFKKLFSVTCTSSTTSYECICNIYINMQWTMVEGRINKSRGGWAGHGPPS